MLTSVHAYLFYIFSYRTTLNKLLSGQVLNLCTNILFIYSLKHSQCKGWASRFRTSLFLFQSNESTPDQLANCLWKLMVQGWTINDSFKLHWCFRPSSKYLHPLLEKWLREDDQGTLASGLCYKLHLTHTLIPIQASKCLKCRVWYSVARNLSLI